MRVALLQMTSGVDPAANRDAILAAMEEARRGGAGMLFTPEMSGCLDRDRARAATHIAAEDADPVLAGVRVRAAELGLWVSLGSLAVADPADEGLWRNRSFVIDPEGGVRARYDKRHLFDVDLPTGERWRESAAYVSGGERAVAVATPWATLGLSICYDLRFADHYRALSDAGAAVLTVPAAFTVPTGQAHWHVLLRARAIENAGFVVAAAQTGAHEDGRHTYGHSLVVDPWGEVLLDMGERAGLGFADLDMKQVAAVRERIPALDHRRPSPDVYRL